MSNSLHKKKLEYNKNFKINIFYYILSNGFISNEYLSIYTYNVFSFLINLYPNFYSKMAHATATFAIF